MTAEALLKAVSALEPFIEEGTDISADGRLAFVRATTGVYGVEANANILENYLCRLTKLYPDQEDALLAARGSIEDFLFEIYEVENSGAPFAAYTRFRSDIISRSQTSPVILTSAQVTRAIPDIDFRDRVTLEGQLRAIAPFGNVAGCFGTGVQSISLIDARLLSTFTGMRSSLAQFLSGQGGLAMRLWLRSPRDIYFNSTASIPTLTIDQLTCIEKESEQIKAADNTVPTSSGS